MQYEVIKQENQQTNEQYIIKTPYTQTDDFGTEVTMYRKEFVTVAGLTNQKENLQAQIDAVEAKLEAIANLK